MCGDGSPPGGSATMASTQSRQDTTSTFGNTKLGYREGQEVRAEAHLQPICTKQKGPKPTHSPEGRLVQPTFDHSPIGYIHKHTDRTEYNSLHDPLLKEHFKKKHATTRLVQSKVMTPDGFVLRSKKYSHSKRHTAALEGVAAKEVKALETARAASKKKAKASFAELCTQKVSEWQDVQRKEAEAIEALKSDVEAKKPAAHEAPLTEQTAIYVEEKKEQFIERKDEKELRSIELAGERRIKQASKDKWLRAEAAAKTASLKEFDEKEAAELAAVKQNIQDTKDSTEAMNAKNLADREARQAKAKAESDAFAQHLQEVMLEREAQQQAEITERKRVAKEEQEERDRKTEEARLEKEERTRLEREAEAKERAIKLEIQRQEELQRKREQLAEKEQRRLAKLAFEEMQRELARANKEQAQRERMEAMEAKERMEAEYERAREARMQANIAEKARREEVMRQQAEDHKKRVAEEAAAKLAYMEAEEAAQQAEFKREQQVLWEQQMMEESAKQDKENCEKRRLKREAELEAARVAEEEARQKKQAEDLVKLKQKRKDAVQENLVRQKAEVERRIAYMEKFG